MQPMRRALRHIIGLGVILVTATFTAGCDEPPPFDPESTMVRPVKAVTIPDAGAGLVRSFPGRVRAAERVDLSFAVSGKLVELPVVQGQELNAGDLVARLDPRDFESTVQAAQARYNETKANYERGKELVEEGHISRMDFDRLKSNFEIAGAELEKARKALADTRLVAAFSGVIARRMVENFQEVRANEAIVSLQDVTSIEIVVNAPERIIAQSRGDGRATITATFEAIPGRAFPLSVKEFSTEADPDTQTYEIIFSMPNPEDANILPGMTAMVRAARPAEEADKRQAITLPASAVFADEQGASQVWVIAADGTVSRRAVQTGSFSGQDQIEIVSGLAAGDTVAVAGVTRLREGQQVRPVAAIEYN